MKLKYNLHEKPNIFMSRCLFAIEDPMTILKTTYPIFGVLVNIFVSKYSMYLLIMSNRWFKWLMFSFSHLFSNCNKVIS